MSASELQPIVMRGTEDSRGRSTTLILFPTDPSEGKVGPRDVVLGHFFVDLQCVEPCPPASTNVGLRVGTFAHIMLSFLQEHCDNCVSWRSGAFDDEYSELVDEDGSIVFRIVRRDEGVWVQGSIGIPDLHWEERRDLEGFSTEVYKGTVCFAEIRFEFPVSEESIETWAKGIRGVLAWFRDGA